MRQKSNIRWIWF